MSQSQILVGGNPAVVAPTFPADQSSGGVFKGEVAAIGGCAKGQLLVVKPLSVGANVPLEPCPAAATVAAQPVGLAKSAATLGEFVEAQFSGIFEMSEADWDAIASTSGGLTAAARYYHDRTTAGDLTSVAPTSGQPIISVGVALSPTQMFLTMAPSTTQA